MGSEFLCKNAGHRPVSLPGMLLFRGCFFSHFAGGNWLPGFSVYSNFTFYFMYRLIILCNFHSNFNITLKNI